MEQENLNTTNNETGNANRNGEGSIGPVIGTFIIVMLLIATALYIWGEHLNAASQTQQQNQVSTTTIITYSTSTNIEDIRSDLQANPPIQNPGF